MAKRNSTNKPTRSRPVAPGARVRTNAAFAAMFPDRPQWHGSVVREFSGIVGSWYVRVDGVTKMQSIHERFLEAEA